MPAVNSEATDVCPSQATDLGMTAMMAQGNVSIGNKHSLPRSCIHTVDSILYQTHLQCLACRPRRLLRSSWKVLR